MSEKKYIKMKLPDGPLFGSKEASECGYFIASPGAEFWVEDLSEKPTRRPSNHLLAKSGVKIIEP